MKKEWIQKSKDSKYFMTQTKPNQHNLGATIPQIKGNLHQN